MAFFMQFKIIFNIFQKKFDFFKFLSGYYMRGKFAGIFENRIRNLQATLKETSAQPQSERDSNRRRQWGQVAERGQVRFLWAFCRLQEIYIYWRFHFNQQKNKTMYVIAESGDTGLLLYKNIGKGKSFVSAEKKHLFNDKYGLNFFEKPVKFCYNIIQVQVGVSALGKGVFTMVAGHLSEKKGYYYAVLNYKDYTGKRKSKWVSTGLPVKGNKRRAEKILADIKRDFVPEEPKRIEANMLFSDYMESWLNIIKGSVAVPTYSSYSEIVNKNIIPYFRERKITLQGLTAKDIQAFYLHELQRVSASTVIHYHANIHKALKYAVKIDLIEVNPADKVERPKRKQYVGSFYDADEINALFEAAKGTKLEFPVLFGAFYGLRRSEAVGLKWDAIDFEENTIVIRHTVTQCNVDGKKVIVASDTTKTKSSRRTLPLVPFVKERLLALKEEQAENRRLCGRSYIKEYLGYVCVNEIGDLIKPGYVTRSFSKLLQANGFRHIRFHDLRHSCASLLLKNGVPMKQIQEWLGHSDFSTTANIYAHLDCSSKLISADAMLNGLGMDSK